MASPARRVLSNLLKTVLLAVSLLTAIDAPAYGFLRAWQDAWKWTVHLLFWPLRGVRDGVAWLLQERLDITWMAIEPWEEHTIVLGALLFLMNLRVVERNLDRLVRKVQEARGLEEPPQHDTPWGLVSNLTAWFALLVLFMGELAMVFSGRCWGGALASFVVLMALPNLLMGLIAAQKYYDGPDRQPSQNDHEWDDDIAGWYNDMVVVLIGVVLLLLFNAWVLRPALGADV